MHKLILAAASIAALALAGPAAAQAPIVADALELARRLADAADAGRVDLGDLGRRARRLLEASTTAEQG